MLTKDFLRFYAPAPWLQDSKIGFTSQELFDGPIKANVSWFVIFIHHHNFILQQVGVFFNLDKKKWEK